jgi:hypothetical protein
MANVLARGAHRIRRATRRVIARAIRPGGSAVRDPPPRAARAFSRGAGMDDIDRAAKRRLIDGLTLGNANGS